MHPPILVKVITLVPAAIPVTSPVALTVATVAVAETHGEVVAAMPEPVSCVVDPGQTFSFPEIVGMAYPVTVAVAVHPELLV